MTPERESRPTHNRAAQFSAKNYNDDTAADTVPAHKRLRWVPCTRPPARQDARSQMTRRRQAALRSAPLDCGCRDPWPCRCSEPPLSDKLVDAGRDAALHVLESGLVPLLKFEVLQALWRRGGEDRELAELLYALTDGALA